MIAKVEHISHTHIELDVEIGDPSKLHGKDEEDDDASETQHSHSTQSSLDTTIQDDPEIGAAESIIIVTDAEIGMLPNNPAKADDASANQLTSALSLDDTIELQSLEDSRCACALHCPLSEKLFKEPVVALDGETYEKSAYMNSKPGRDEDEILYVNRAVMTIIDDMINDESESYQTNWERLESMAKRAVIEFLDFTTRDDTSSQQALSDGFYCPITCNLIHDPVIDPDGNTYEKVAITNWILIHGNSPITRTALSLDQLRPNHVIRRLLEEEMTQSADHIHPEILRWSEEPAPQASDLEYGGSMIAASSSALNASGVPQTDNLSPEQLRLYRRGVAKRQMIYNLTGILICILLLKFVHG